MGLMKKNSSLFSVKFQYYSEIINLLANPSTHGMINAMKSIEYSCE